MTKAQIMAKARLITGHSPQEKIQIAICIGEERENARLLPLIEALADVIETCVSEKDGRVLNCAFDCAFEGAHPACKQCAALAKLKERVK